MNTRMAKGRQCLEKVRRCVRTLFFMVAMLMSLLVLSLPVLVAMGDVLVPCVLISSFTCTSCYGFKEHLNRYSFRSSLTDIPLVSVVRSLVIICVYSMCDGPAISNDPYLGTATICSFISMLLLSVKACIFTVNSHIEVESSSSISGKKLHLKKSWGMPVLFLSSVVFALGHIVVAYRTSCRVRRKLLLHRVDPEVVLPCKNVFSSYQKVPRSPTPGAKVLKSDTELRRNPFGTVRDEEVPVRLLSDVDSLFITCQNLTLHFKHSLPGSPHSLTAINIPEQNLTCNTPSIPSGRANFERHRPNLSSKSQLQRYRSYSNQFPVSSLYTPLLDGFVGSPVHSEDVPVFRLDEISAQDEVTKSNSTSAEKEIAGFGQFGIVLVHGFGGGVFSWRHVMDTLSQQLACSVVAFDRPGWGLSSRLRKEDWEGNQMPNPYKLDTQVELLLSFCFEMGFSSVVLIGHDDGGLLALKAAQRARTSTVSFNVAIKGVVLLNVSLTREVVPSFARILLHTSLGKKHLVRPLLRVEITQVVNRHAWYDATKLTTEVLNLYKAPLYVEGWDQALHEIGKLSYETVLSPQNAQSLLEAVEDIPFLVIAGAEDSIVPLRFSQAIASKLVNSRLVAISGCGHLPHEECPKAFLAAITPFISKLLPSLDLESQ